VTGRSLNLRAVAGALSVCAAVLLLAGCSWLPWHRHKHVGCTQKPFAGNTAVMPPLKVPDGLSAPDTRTAVKIPELTDAEQVRAKTDPCLDEPPPFGTVQSRPPGPRQLPVTPTPVAPLPLPMPESTMPAPAAAPPSSVPSLPSQKAPTTEAPPATAAPPDTSSSDSGSQTPAPPPFVLPPAPTSPSDESSHNASTSPADASAPPASAPTPPTSDDASAPK